MAGVVTFSDLVILVACAVIGGLIGSLIAIWINGWWEGGAGVLIGTALSAPILMWREK